MNRNLKAKIIEHFGSQADFAQKLQIDESLVSRVIRGRRKLPQEEVGRWCDFLKCDTSIIPMEK